MLESVSIGTQWELASLSCNGGEIRPASPQNPATTSHQHMKPGAANLELLSGPDGYFLDNWGWAFKNLRKQ